MSLNLSEDGSQPSAARFITLESLTILNNAQQLELQRLSYSELRFLRHAYNERNALGPTQSDHTPPPSAEVKKGGAITPLPQNVFIERYLTDGITIN
jgi:hypothetical protein